MNEAIREAKRNVLNMVGIDDDTFRAKFDTYERLQNAELSALADRLAAAEALREENARLRELTGALVQALEAQLAWRGPAYGGLSQPLLKRARAALQPE